MTDQVQRQKVETQVRELTPVELEHVGGGAHRSGVLVALGDGSVRNIGGTDLADWQANYGAGG